ncbi:MAG: S8 family serine peptidase [Luteimonas sp.]
MKMKHSSISLAVATAIFASGVAASGAVAGDRISGAKTLSELAMQHVVAASDGQRFMVKYREDAATAGGLGASLDIAVSRAGLDRALPSTHGSTARAPVHARVLRPMAASDWHVVRTSRPLNASEAASFIRELSADAAVETAEADHLYQRLQTQSPATAPDDPNYGDYQWNFFDADGGVRAEEAWGISTGEGVVVAILDTGIVENHMDLAANVVPGYDMLTDARMSRRDTDERAPGGWDLGDWTEADYCTGWATDGAHPAVPSSWHGSHVAGTVAQETNNGTGLAGVAHGAQVMPVRVLGSCGGFGSDIADGMIWAAGGTVEGMPDNAHPAEILNMSLGSAGPSQCSALYQDAIDQVNAMGSIIVAAAGNSNADAGTYTMASCDGVIAVGATGLAGGKAGYSNHGERVDLSAPGGGGGIDGNPDGYIWQVVNGGEQGPVEGDWWLGGMSGTSMAAPHVAAAAAMVQSVAEMPLDWQQMRDLLTATARPFPVAIPAATPIGAGILDLQVLLETVTEEPCDPEAGECDPDPEAIPLVNREPVSGLDGEAGSEMLYAIELPDAVVGALLITTSGGRGDVSVHVRYGEEPVAGSAGWSSTRPGNSELVSVSAPQAGTYYIKLVAEQDYEGVTLQARHN